LWLLLCVTTSAYAQLALLGGEPPLLTAINTGVISSEDLGSRTELGQQLDLIYGLVWMLPLAFVAAGWPVRRTAGETLQRLGLVRPTWWQLAVGVVAAVALAVLMGYLGEWLSQLWNWFGWPETDAVAFEQLLGGLLNPVGAIIIGITAGLGEELAVRGVLQPRLGLLLSNLAFTAIHAYQYSFDALLIVFLLGTILGIIRHYTNTTTAAAVHGVYNVATILLALPG
jgi:membrane protease YdiL (CAAX protease family)